MATSEDSPLNPRTRVLTSRYALTHLLSHSRVLVCILENGLPNGVSNVLFCTLRNGPTVKNLSNYDDHFFFLNILSDPFLVREKAMQFLFVLVELFLIK